MKKEIDLYKKYKDYISYGFYVIKKFRIQKFLIGSRQSV